MTIRLARPDVGAAELAAVEEVLASGWLTMGPKVAELEAELAQACEVPYAAVVSSGTAALHVALLALGIGPGDEVVVPAYTFPATANVVALCGAKPVLADVDPETMNVSLEAVESLLGAHTRLVIAVHLFGRPLDWDALRALVPAEIPILEDAAGALGARSRGRACGSLGVMGCLSFHPRKIVTTGEGGAVLGHDETLDAAIRSGRHHGIAARGPFDIAAAGTNYRLADVNCALALPQIRRLPELLNARRRVAAGYAERLAGLVDIPAADEGDEHGWQAYVVGVDRRDEVMASLRAQEIECQIGTYALHRLGAYRDQGLFPGADRAYERALALPLHSGLSEGDLDRVAEALRASLG
ncbi:MAG: DegT/DnrJ/EryC1/StrS family aminotransferase [Gaiellaceae bacterium]